MGSTDESGSVSVSVPPSTSPDLTLVAPTETERIECLRINGASWRGPLTLDQYLRREELLENQDMTRHGALRTWILVDRNEPPNFRTILCSCETFAKRVFVAHAGGGGLEDDADNVLVAHTVGSVFCRPEFRGRGYARRMTDELAKVLDTWHHQEKEDAATREKTVFSTLYSDIGKQFYAAHGWKAFPATHITLDPYPRPRLRPQQPREDVIANGNGNGHHHAVVDMSLVKDMRAEDVETNMCSAAVLAKHRTILKDASRSDGRTKVAIVPDYAHMCWHWAREEFYIDILCPEKGFPGVKGAAVPDRGVYLCWNRRYGGDGKDRTLYILRTLYDEPASQVERQALVQGLAAALRRAQVEAHEWDMGHVEIWNPSPPVQEAAKMLDQGADLVHRDSYRIPSLRWNGEQLGLGRDVDVDWVWNERYAWC